MTVFWAVWVLLGLTTFTIDVVIVRLENSSIRVKDLVIGFLIHVILSPAGLLFVVVKLGGKVWDAISMPQRLKDFWNKEIL